MAETNKKIVDLNRQIDKLVAQLQTVDAAKYEETPILQQIIALQEQVAAIKNGGVTPPESHDMRLCRKNIAASERVLKDKIGARGDIQYQTRFLAATYWYAIRDDELPRNLRPPSSSNPNIPWI